MRRTANIMRESGEDAEDENNTEEINDTEAVNDTEAADNGDEKHHSGKKDHHGHEKHEGQRVAMPAVSGCSAPLTVCILPAPFIISLSPSQELWRVF